MTEKTNVDAEARKPKRIRTRTAKPLAIARAFINSRMQEEDQVLTINGQVYQFNTKHYEEYQHFKRDVRRFADGLFDDAGGVMRLTAITEAIMDEVNVVNIAPAFWLDGREDAREFLLPMQNGLLDPLTEQLIPHTPEYFCPYILPFDYTPEVKAPKWEEFLGAVTLHDSEVTALLQEMAGYSLSLDTSMHKMFVLLGAGRNGKSTFLEILTAMIGSKNVSAVPLERFGARFALDGTENKLANIVGETTRIDRGIDEGILKTFVAGDLIQVDRKYRDAIQLRPTAKVIIATNDMSGIRDTSLGMLSRLVIVPFSRVFKPNEIIPNFAEQLKDELPGILNWALAGRKRLYEQKRFTEPARVALEKRQFELETSSVRGFLAFYEFEEKYDAAVYVTSIYDAYRYWCKLNGKSPVASERFTRELRQTFPGVIGHRIKVEGETLRVHVGLVTPAVTLPTQASGENREEWAAVTVEGTALISALAGAYN